MATSTIKAFSINLNLISSVTVSENGTFPIDTTSGYSLVYIELMGNDANRSGLLVPNRQYILANLAVSGNSTIYVKGYVRINNYNTMVITDLEMRTWTAAVINVYGVTA